MSELSCLNRIRSTSKQTMFFYSGHRSKNELSQTTLFQGYTSHKYKGISFLSMFFQDIPGHLWINWRCTREESGSFIARQPASSKQQVTPSARFVRRRDNMTLSVISLHGPRW